MKALKLITGVIALAAASVALASPVTVTQTGVGAGSTVRIYDDGNWRNVFAGQIRHTISGAIGMESWMNGNKITYCADLDQLVDNDPTAFNTTAVANLSDSDPMGTTRANAIRDMFVFASGAQISNSATSDFATAFQLAIWEVINDYSSSASGHGLSITSGDFRAKKTDGSALSSGVTSNLTALFAVAGSSMTSSGLNYMGIRSDCAQDQIVSDTFVPTPGVLAVVSFGGLAAMRRRRGN